MAFLHYTTSERNLNSLASRLKIDRIFSSLWNHGLTFDFLLRQFSHACPVVSRFLRSSCCEGSPVGRRGFVGDDADIDAIGRCRLSIAAWWRHLESIWTEKVLFHHYCACFSLEFVDRQIRNCNHFEQCSALQMIKYLTVLGRLFEALARWSEDLTYLTLGTLGEPVGSMKRVKAGWLIGWAGTYHTTTVSYVVRSWLRTLVLNQCLEMELTTRHPFAYLCFESLEVNDGAVCCTSSALRVFHSRQSLQKRRKAL